MSINCSKGSKIFSVSMVEPISKIGANFLYQNKNINKKSHITIKLIHSLLRSGYKI